MSSEWHRYPEAGSTAIVCAVLAMAFVYYGWNPAAVIMILGAIVFEAIAVKTALESGAGDWNDE